MLLSTKKLIEAVARGANPKAAVSSFLKSRLTEDDDVATMLSGEDTGEGPLGGADVEDPEDDAGMDKEDQEGPGSPIVPNAGDVSIDADPGAADLGTAGASEVDSAEAAADTAEDDDEFMEAAERLRIRRRVRESLSRMVKEEGGEMPDFIKDKMDKSDDDDSEDSGDEEEGGDEEEKKEESRRRARIRARIREARARRRKMVAEDDDEDAKYHMDFHVHDNSDDDDMDEEDTDAEVDGMSESYHHREQKSILRSTSKGKGKLENKFESIGNTFRDHYLAEEDLDPEKVDGAVEPPGSEDLPDEGDEEVMVSPTESRHNKLRKRLETIRRRRMQGVNEEEEEDVNFPPADYKMMEPAEDGDEDFDNEGGEFTEGILSDLTGGEVDDEDDDELKSVPESADRRRKNIRKFLEARRRKMMREEEECDAVEPPGTELLPDEGDEDGETVAPVESRRRKRRRSVSESAINPMFQPGVRVRQLSTGRVGKIVDNEVYSKGGHRYMVAFLDEMVTEQVGHSDLEKL